MSETAKPDWRELKRDKRSEERTIRLIERLYRAVLLLKADAEKQGFVYGEQSVCQKAIEEYHRWNRDRQTAQKNLSLTS